ncbi:ABC transporter substrate-binding protein [Microbacterium aurantiacum]|uniref:ABC transporter substrate-binding protein n=1 Tax=Microbacterium aurantiacum TaxID=162393 RepID=A0AAJ2HI79_9MICO|nr:ABC transporter substrate-binding protein [Microbacterium aurantiacum]MDS0244864.1 ABC transporter substrate-binding protein [Microbacterium aurantiacum]
MQHRIRSALPLLAVLGVTVALSGCSSEPAESGDGVTLTVWYNTQGSDALMNVYSAYEQASGNKVELVPISSDGYADAVLAKWATGDRPDILEFAPTSSYISMLNPGQNLLDLSDEEFVDASGELYDGSGRGTDGKVYAAITSFPEVWGVYYNKDVLAANGLEPATTVDAIREQCATLSAAGVTTLAEAGGSGWPTASLPLLYGTSSADESWTADVVAREVTVADEDSPLLAGFEVYAQLLADGCMSSDISTATFEDSVADVLAGEAAYQLIHSNIAPVYVDAANGDAELVDETIGFTTVGASTKAAFIQPGIPGSYLLPRTGDDARQAAAREFVRFATGEHYPTFIEESGTFPVIVGTPDPESATGLMIDIKNSYDEGPLRALMQTDLPGAMNGIVVQMSELIAGQATPQQVADQLQTELETAATAQGLDGW